MKKDDDWYWELLEEQHKHDVRISGSVEGDGDNGSEQSE